MAEWKRRQQIVAAYEASPTTSFRQAAKRLGILRQTLQAFIAKYEKNHDLNDLIPGIGSGRRSIKSKLEKELGAAAVSDAIAKVKGCISVQGSVSASWRYLASTGQLHETIAQVILDPSKASKHNIPKSLTNPSLFAAELQLLLQGRRSLKTSDGRPSKEPRNNQ